MNVLRLIGKNVVRMVTLLIAVSIVAFALVSVSPIDPVRMYLGDTVMASMSQEQLEKVQEYWGVNQPPVQRYLAWAKDFVRGDMGESLLYRRPVSQVVGEKFLNSILLLLTAWLISGVLGFVLGVASGFWRGRWPDRLIKGYSLVMASAPTFWLALILLMVFGVWLKVLPIGMSVPVGVAASDVTLGDRLIHLILPGLALSITGVANIALHTREKMIDVMKSDYVLYARAKGEGMRSIVLRHGLRNVALPALTLQFASISEIFGGSILVEQVFSYPGLGQAAVTAGLGGDVPLLLAIAIVSACFVFVGNLTANLLYNVVDPRIRRRQLS